MRVSRGAVAALVVAGLLGGVAAGCGGDDDSGEATTKGADHDSGPGDDGPAGHDDGPGDDRGARG
jgi:hypothetical protein